MTAAALILAAALLLVAVVLLPLVAARLRGEARVRQLRAELAGPTEDGEVFREELLAGLPAPARRWLAHAIAPGTPLRRTALLRMHGTILLDPARPALPMRATQVIAAPGHGFLWEARVGSGLMSIRGYDRYERGTGELRWWILGLVPAVTGSGPDVDRSAAGRLAGEAALAPAALLPGPGVQWEAMDDGAARVRIQVGAERVACTLRVAADGRLERVVINRWNGDPRNGPVGYLPFSAEFDGEQHREGYTLPVRISAGWASPGSETSRPFFHAQLDQVEFR